MGIFHRVADFARRNPFWTIVIVAFVLTREFVLPLLLIGGALAMRLLSRWMRERRSPGARRQPVLPTLSLSRSDDDVDRAEERKKEREQRRLVDDRREQLSDKIHQLNRKADEHWRKYQDAEGDWGRHGSPHMDRGNLTADQRKILERSDREKEAYDRLQEQIRDLERQRDKLR